MFKVQTAIKNYEDFNAFASEFEIKGTDLIITTKRVCEKLLKNTKAKVILKDEYGKNEPSNKMIEKMLEKIANTDYKRVIAIGGGSVLDISKLFAIEFDGSVKDLFERKVDFKRNKELILIPTTCGTGSEVTNISITEIEELKTKKGLADDRLFPNFAIIIDSLLNTMPYKVFATSSIDALIHAVESYLSPKATSHSMLFSVKAIEMILNSYKKIVEDKADYKELLKEVMTASNFAGIAFGNAGCGAVHAISYPLGGKYHVPHGEANYQFFTEVLKKYEEKDNKGKLIDLKKLLAKQLEVEEKDVNIKLEELLDEIISRNPLKNYGMTKQDIDLFTEIVLKTQVRLLNNNHTELNYDDIKDIYMKLY